MTRSVSAAPVDLLADPFGERATRVLCEEFQLLGGLFRFETTSPLLLQLVRSAYAGLPPHRLTAAVPRFRIRLALSGAAPSSGASDDPPAMTMLSGAGYLCGTSPASSFVVMNPSEHTALVVVSEPMARSAYHTRYELIEFAVYMLAARGQGLVSLHAGCVGIDGRGLLLIGPSGSGKSTAALHCLLQGFDFVSEDSVLVATDSLLATGVANFLHIRSDGLRFLARTPYAAKVRRSPVIRRRSGVRKYEVDLRRLGLELADAPLKITAIVFATDVSADEGTPLLRSLRKAERLTRLRETQTYAANNAGWNRLMRGLAAVPALELRRGQHPREAVAALRALLETPDGEAS